MCVCLSRKSDQICLTPPFFSKFVCPNFFLNIFWIYFYNFLQTNLLIFSSFQNLFLNFFFKFFLNFFFCDPDLLHGLERLCDIFHGKIEHSWLCRQPTAWKKGAHDPSTGHLRQQSLIETCKLWRLVNEILDQSKLLWSSWQLLFLVPPLQPHYPNRNHGAGGAQVAWTGTRGGGFEPACP